MFHMHDVQNSVSSLLLIPVPWNATPMNRLHSTVLWKIFSSSNKHNKHKLYAWCMLSYYSENATKHAMTYQVEKWLRAGNGSRSSTILVISFSEKHVSSECLKQVCPKFVENLRVCVYRKELQSYSWHVIWLNGWNHFMKEWVYLYGPGNLVLFMIFMSRQNTSQCQLSLEYNCI